MSETAATETSERSGEGARKKLPTAAWVGIVAAALLVGFFVLRSKPSNGTEAALKPPAAPATPPPKAGTVALPGKAGDKNPISTTKVEKAKLAADLVIVGSVSYDQDHYAVVGPLVPGRVARLVAGVGDIVRKGQVLAEIESSEVGEAQAGYLSARARLSAAEANLRREQDLAAQRISSARDRELAEANAISSRAEQQAAVERLHAYGLGESDIRALQAGQGTAGRVPLRASVSGTVVARKVTLGQAVERATDAFTIVDLRHLWVLLDLYEKDLSRVHVGQAVELRTEAYPGEVFKARVAYINPVIDPATRTANVRIEFDNPDGKLRPGQFVTAKLLGDPEHPTVETIAVSRKAVQSVDGKTLVFVKTADGFEKRMIEIGLSGGELIEVKQGLAEGEEVATDGAFLLKSELLR